MLHISYRVETELEADGRWIAEIVDVPGVMAYGATEKEAVALAQALPCASSPIALKNRRNLPKALRSPSKLRDRDAVA